MSKHDVNFDLQDPVFSGDRFRMYEFKIKRCPKAKPHDWTQCPFAHPGEKAKRRDPRRFSYSGSACPEFRKAGVCSRGDACPLAHGVFETWLHPTRYKTQMCMDGGACRRKVCFFAHSQSELRMTGQAPAFHDAPMPADALHLLSGQVPSLELLHLLHQGQPFPPQPHDVAALLAAAGLPAGAYPPHVPHPQPQQQPPQPPTPRELMPDPPPAAALFRQDSIVSTPAPTRVHDAAMLQPKSLHRHLSLDARHYPVGSPELEPALSAMLQNLSLSTLEPVCEASAVAPELGLSRASVQSGGFVLPHDYQLTSRSTVDNGVLAHMREIAQTELSKLSEAELAVLSKAYNETGPAVYGMQQHTPRGTPSPPSGASFAATTPTAAAGSVLSVSTSQGASQSPREATALSNNGEAASPHASTSAPSPASGVAAWTAADIKRNFSIERLLSELPRSMSDMDVAQIVAASQGGAVAVAGGACH